MCLIFSYKSAMFFSTSFVNLGCKSLAWLRYFFNISSDMYVSTACVSSVNDFIICIAFLLSSSLWTLSVNSHIKSNLDMSGGGTSKLSDIGMFKSYLPDFGFAAEMIVVFDGRLIWIPAFAIDTVCCSIASCSPDLSSGFILSNSSMNAWPPEHNGSTPAIATILLSDSLTIPIVRPAAVAPLPEVYIDFCVTLFANFNNSDFAIDGSPTNSMCVLPLFIEVVLPPTNPRRTDSLIVL